MGLEFLIRDIARRIAAAGQVTSTAAYQIWRAQNLGVSQKKVMAQVRKLLGASESEMEALLERSAELGHGYDLSRFPTAEAVPFAENTGLQQILDATVQMAREDMSNVTQTLGFVTYDGKCEELTRAYEKSCDFAFQKVVTGAQSYTEAIRDAVRGLAEKGIRSIDYESGVHRSLEAAVRGSIMGGLGLMQEKISQQNHDDLGCDGWEISAHAASAPDHEPIQGKQYSDAAYTRLNNSLVRRIGTLNCGHSASPIILGINSPQYSKKELEEFRRANEEGIEYEGKHYTMYEATQRQRSLERSMRSRKRRILIDEATGDKERLQADQIRLVRTREEYHRFSEAAGLREQWERAEAAGFGRKQAAAVNSTAEDVFKNPPDDLEMMSRKVHKALDKHCARKSKWSGTTLVRPRAEMVGVNGRKAWNCDIVLREDTGVKTVVHEHLHARSVSYYDEKTYLLHQKAEEGSVELFAQEICKLSGTKFRAAYPETVQKLRIINSISRISDDYGFAKQLFDIALPERYNWLRRKADELIATGKLSGKTIQSLDDAVEYFRGRGVK